jgi:type II secretory pathway component PulF
LEPLLILLLGLTVGGIAVAIMMPIFSLTSAGG